MRRFLSTLIVLCAVVLMLSVRPPFSQSVEPGDAGAAKTDARLAAKPAEVDAAEGASSVVEDAVPERLGERGRSICPLLDPVAVANGLPPVFFARLIWQESRFRDDAISPKGAQGIAQFMPGTAALRGLDDPFEPKSALAASGAFLADLRREFGNLGLAAAAYNAGEQRVRDWLAGRRAALPLETQNYVLIITGRSPEEWRDGAEGEPAMFSAGDEAATACQRLALTLAGLPDKPEDLAPSAPWGVQIAGGFSRSRTLAAFERTRRRYSSIIGEMRPILLHARDRGRGRRMLHQARIGAQTRADAERLCNRLRLAGGACIVLRN